MNENEKYTLLKQETPRFLLTALLLGIIYAVMFCRSDARGLNTLLYQLAWCVAVFLSLRRLGAEKKANAVWYAAILLLAGTVFYTGNSFIQSVSRVGILLCKAFLLLGAFSELWDWHFGKVVGAVLRLCWKSLAKLLEPFSHLRALRKEKNDGKGRYILLGLVLAVPLLCIVVPLLTSSDAVFRSMLRSVFGWDVPELLKTALEAVGLALLCALAFYCPLCAQTADAETTEQRERKKAHTLVAVTFTAVLTLLYLFYCGVRVTVLFRGGETVLPSGMTYAEYAREGFFELLAVSAINLLLVIVAQRRFESSRALRILLTLISVCTYLMAASSARRMLLYVSVYGFTFWRLLVLWFLAVVAILLGGAVWTVYHSEFRLFTFSVGVCLVLWLLFAYARPDRIAARYDLERFGVSDSSVSCVLYDLSEEAVPILLRYDLSETNYKEELNGYLLSSLPREVKAAGLRGFNFSLWEAGNSMRKAINESGGIMSWQRKQ